MNDAVIKRRKRGEANKDDLAFFSSFSEHELLSFLRSEEPVERTCAAIYLQKFQNITVIDAVCDQLSVEKKLYTKLALCETLTGCAELSLNPLIALLGKIGNNHETKIPGTGFYKVSYPLPLDIAARTICRLGHVGILPLEHFIEFSKKEKAIAQAIDAYGHILYSNKIERPSSTLQKLSEKYSENNFLRYKITRCLSGFHGEWAKEFLLETLRKGCGGLKLEALRSLTLLKIALPKDMKNSFSDEMRQLELFIQKRQQ
ncbi:MAG: hypothetical protein K8S27_08880 [Candidatus Omnitrophica bacterium]|nr:hypothetical protein [Candidatus Omnitrophota bacterium]